jgi:DNA-binding transcriptional ArsR family regulator
MRVTSLDAAIAATRALGHPARMRTAAMLRSGELCLCQITEVLALAPSTVGPALESVAGDPQLERDLELVAELRRLPVADLCSVGFEAAKAKFEVRAPAHAGEGRS